MFWKGTMSKSGCRQSLADAISAVDTDVSGSAASYVRVFDMLGQILLAYYSRLVGWNPMWYFVPSWNSCALNNRQDEVWCHEGVKMVLQ